jgi:hypothetical protein
MSVSDLKPCLTDSCETYLAVRNASTSFSRHLSASTTQEPSTSGDTWSDDWSTRSDSTHSLPLALDAAMLSNRRMSDDRTMSPSSGTGSIIKKAVRSKPHIARAQVVIIAGPPGCVKLLSLLAY